MNARHDGLTAVDQAVMRLESLLFEPHGDGEFFDLHSLPMAEFLRGMACCGEPREFIDLGCGIGTKLAVAYYLGWQVTGVEHDSSYVATARRLVPEANLIVADARSVRLDSYDVVYSYRLFTELEDQARFNDLLASKMKPGALYFCAGSDPTGLEEVGNGVWRVA